MIRAFGYFLGVFCRVVGINQGLRFSSMFWVILGVFSGFRVIEFKVQCSCSGFRM